MANIIVPRRKEHFFDSNGNPTHRFIAFLETLTTQTNETTEKVVNITGGEGNQSYTPALLQQLQLEAQGLPEFTMDTTGFTMDTTEFTMDKVIA